MKILRAFKVIKKEWLVMISITYNEADNSGNITRTNAKDSFYAVTPELQAAIKVIEDHINNRLAGE